MFFLEICTKNTGLHANTVTWTRPNKCCIYRVFGVQLGSHRKLPWVNTESNLQFLATSLNYTDDFPLFWHDTCLQPLPFRKITSIIWLQSSVFYLHLYAVLICPNIVNDDTLMVLMTFFFLSLLLWKRGPCVYSHSNNNNNRCCLHKYGWWRRRDSGRGSLTISRGLNTWWTSSSDEGLEMVDFRRACKEINGGIYYLAQ